MKTEKDLKEGQEVSRRPDPGSSGSDDFIRLEVGSVQPESESGESLISVRGVSGDRWTPTTLQESPHINPKLLEFRCQLGFSKS